MTFDLEKARALCNQATFKATGNPINEDLKLLVDQSCLLPAALDRILELESALIEERARRICHDPRADKVGHWPRYERVVVDESRQQLRSEGKI